MYPIPAAAPIFKTDLVSSEICPPVAFEKITSATAVVRIPIAPPFRPDFNLPPIPLPNNNPKRNPLKPPAGISERKLNFS